LFQVHPFLDFVLFITVRNFVNSWHLNIAGHPCSHLNYFVRATAFRSTGRGFYETRMFIAVFKKSLLCREPYPRILFFFNVYFNIILLSTPRSLKWSFPPICVVQISMHIQSPSPHTHHYSLSLRHLITVIMLGEEYKLCSSSS
jgi:hypothetical protein